MRHVAEGLNGEDWAEVQADALGIVAGLNANEKVVGVQVKKFVLSIERNDEGSTTLYSKTIEVS
jgi:hypothetical protein